MCLSSQKYHLEFATKSCSKLATWVSSPEPSKAMNFTVQKYGNPGFSPLHHL